MVKPVCVKFNRSNSGSHFWVYLVLLFGITVSLPAQNVRVSAKIDSNHIYVGDWIKLNIELNYPIDVKVTWPPIADSLGKLEIVNRTSPAITRTDKSINEKMLLTITAFDTGTHTIPPLIFTYRKIQAPNGKIDSTELSVQSDAITIFVRSVGIDTAAEIKDIKPPLGVPITLADLLPYIIGIVVIGLIIYASFYISKRKRKIVSEIFSTPKRPAHEIALESLQSLESEKLWQRGEIKLYHSKLSDIIRTYIEHRFTVPAMESTTNEIIEDLRRIKINGSLTDTLQVLLTTADLVKFAKGQPLANENDLCLKNAYDFVNQTIQQVQQAVEEIKNV
jgi:hypothetical protein